MTTYALIGTKPEASKAFWHVCSVNTSKNASLKAGRNVSLSIWKTRRRADALSPGRVGSILASVVRNRPHLEAVGYAMNVVVYRA